MPKLGWVPGSMHGELGFWGLGHSVGGSERLLSEGLLSVPRTNPAGSTSRPLYLQFPPPGPL